MHPVGEKQWISLPKGPKLINKYRQQPQLESLPLSALSADNSNPPQVNYGTEQPLTVSTPRAISTSTQETQAADTFRQIVPGSRQVVRREA